MRRVLHILPAVALGMAAIASPTPIAESKPRFTLPLTPLALHQPLVRPEVAPPPAPVPEPIQTPMDCVKVALADVMGGYGHCSSRRYFALYNIPPVLRAKYKQTLDWVINSLSRRRNLALSVELPSAKNPLVLMIDLENYGISPKAFDDLARRGSGTVPLPEPYFNVAVEQVEDYYFAGDKQYPAGTYQNIKKLVSPAPWIMPDGGTQIQALQKFTCAQSPILRADWFVTYASWAPGYYRLLGLKGKEADFDKLVRVDEKLAAVSQVAAIPDSKRVTLHNRIILRLPTVNGLAGGSYWTSFDTAKGIDNEDYLNNIDTFDKPSFVAKEIIATLTNTLQVYAVADKDGKLLNVADPNVAIHKDVLPTRLGDKQIFAGLRNCAICHYGFQDIDCKVRKLANGPIGLSNFVRSHKDKKLQEKIVDAFSPDINGLVAHDNLVYQTAIKALNGLDPRTNAQQFEDFTYNYLDEIITPEVAAGECGVTVEALVAAAKTGIGVDHTIMSLGQNPPIPVSRLNWERRGFFQMMQLLQPPTPVKVPAKKTKTK